MSYRSLMLNSPTVLKFEYNRTFTIYSFGRAHKTKTRNFTSKEKLKIKSIIDYTDILTFNVTC